MRTTSLACHAIAGAFAAGLLALRVAGAQSAPQAPRAAARQTLATNPLALPFGAVSAEYERAVGRGGFALGVGGSASFSNRVNGSFSGGDFAAVEGKVKYYPAENGLRGFAVGATLGVIHGRDDVYQSESFVIVPCTPNTTCVAQSTTVFRRATAPTLGAVLDYNWLIGRRRRFLVGVGVGARRVLGNATTRDVLGDVLPDGRLVVGIGF